MEVTQFSVWAAVKLHTWFVFVGIYWIVALLVLLLILLSNGVKFFQLCTSAIGWVMENESSAKIGSQKHNLYSQCCRLFHLLFNFVVDLAP